MSQVSWPRRLASAVVNFLRGEAPSKIEECAKSVKNVNPEAQIPEIGASYSLRIKADTKGPPPQTHKTTPSPSDSTTYKTADLSQRIIPSVSTEESFQKVQMAAKERLSIEYVNELGQKRKELMNQRDLQKNKLLLLNEQLEKEEQKRAASPGVDFSMISLEPTLKEQIERLRGAIREMDNEIKTLYDEQQNILRELDRREHGG